MFVLMIEEIRPCVLELGFEPGNKKELFMDPLET